MSDLERDERNSEVTHVDQVIFEHATIDTIRGLLRLAWERNGPLSEVDEMILANAAKGMLICLLRLEWAENSNSSPQLHV